MANFAVIVSAMRQSLPRLLLLFSMASSAPCGAAAPTDAPLPQVVDLGHALSEKDPTWSGAPSFSRVTVETYANDGYTAGKFASDEHFGTHVDAPAHFAKGAWTVDQIPVDRLLRPAVCINITKQAATSDDYRLSVADVQAFEKEHGQIPEGDVVFIATGWDSRWTTPARYMNVQAGVRHFPGISAEAASLLAKDRKVYGIGIDTASIDYGASEKFEAHHTTMPLGVYHIENATNLTTLPATGFTVVVAPINLTRGSGGPERVFALLRETSQAPSFPRRSVRR